MKHKITEAAFLAFAKKNAGNYFKTVSRGRPFMVDVIDEAIVCYPKSKIDVWLSPSIQVKRFNATNSLRTRDYPSETFSNSYFVGLVAAMLGRTKPIPTTKLHPSRSASLPPSPELEAKVRRLRKATVLLPPAGNERPPRKKVSTFQVWRDPAVKAWVLRSSKGRCASCGSPAPFSADDDLPFLEVHHVIPLADGGPDTITNAVAVCPNCHRAFHLAKDRKRRIATLYERFPRLKK